MRHIILSSMIFSTMLLAPYGFAGQVEQVISGKHLKVSGVVSKVESGSVLIATPRGQIALSPAGALKTLKVGEAVNVWLNERTTVIAVRPVDVTAHGKEQTGTQPDDRVSIDRPAVDPGLIF
ncbi:MAG TPA: hypothetical protein VJ692_09700 [Nitrospiraceae bacterium]|nr:hypothetical protein [Nitrospiraceae bacterium]